MAARLDGIERGISPPAVRGRIRCGAPGVANSPRIEGGRALSADPGRTDGTKPDWNMTGLPPAEEGLEACESSPPSRVERIISSSLPRLRCDDADEARRKSLRRFPFDVGNGAEPMGGEMAEGRKTASSPFICGKRIGRAAFVSRPSSAATNSRTLKALDASDERRGRVGRFSGAVLGRRRPAEGRRKEPNSRGGEEGESGTAEGRGGEGGATNAACFLWMTNTFASSSALPRLEPFGMRSSPSSPLPFTPIRLVPPALTTPTPALPTLFSLDRPNFQLASSSSVSGSSASCVAEEPVPEEACLRMEVRAVMLDFWRTCFFAAFEGRGVDDGGAGGIEGGAGERFVERLESAHMDESVS